MYEPELFRTPGYPMFLVPFYWLFGRVQLPVYLAQALLHAGAALMIYFLVVRTFSSRAAYLSALLVALNPLTAVYVPTILVEPLSLFVTTLSVCLFLRVVDRPTALRAAILGVVVGYGALVRPPMLLFSFFLFLCAWVAAGRFRGLIKAFFISHAVFAAVMTPWVVRNYRISGEFIPLSIEAPLQLWLATLNYGPYTDAYWTHPLYPLQHWLEAERRKFLFDRVREPFPLEVRVHRPGRLRPIHVHYQLNEQGPFREVRMREVSSGRFRADIPGQPWGTSVRYFFTVRDPEFPDEKLRLPPATKGAIFYYRVARNALEDLGEEIIDLNFLSKLAKNLTGRLVAPGVNEKALDLDKDGLLTQKDFEKALGLLSGENSQYILRRRGSPLLKLRFSDGTRLEVPETAAGESVFPSLAEKRTTGTARLVTMKAIVRKQRPRDPSEEGAGVLPHCDRFWFWSRIDPDLPPTLKSPELDITPCYWYAGIEPVARELLRFRVYNFLFWNNLLRMPMEYIGGSLLRMPRLWVVVGRAQESGQTYLTAGAGWLYPALTLATLLMLVMALAGFAATWRTWRDHWYLAAPVIYISLVHSPFHPEARYSFPGRPFLLVYCAIALMSLWEMWKGRPRSRPDVPAPPSDSPR